MFTELKLKNFQSLGETTIELGKITVLIGPSFLGKSALVRALYTLTRNRFEGSFMKKGTSSTSVELKEGDTWVKYLRESSSSYTFSGNPEPYTKIGREVPADIRDFLNMDEVIFDSDLSLDFNFQRQFDSYFILSLSGFEIAKVFGKLMNLDIVLTASREINRDIQYINKQKDECTAIQDVSVKYIQEHHSIELKYSLLQEALKLEEEAESIEKQAESLLSLIADIEYENLLMEKLNSLSLYLDTQGIDEMLEPPQGLEDTLVSALYEEGRISMLSSLLEETLPIFDFEQFSTLESTIVESEFINSSYKNWQKLAKEIDAEDFEIISSIEELNNLIIDGDEVNSTFLLNKNELSRIDALIEQKKKDFSDFIEKNNICPITKLPFTESCLAELKGGI